MLVYFTGLGYLKRQIAMNKALAGVLAVNPQLL
jgi:hypothetical protein